MTKFKPIIPIIFIIIAISVFCAGAFCDFNFNAIASIFETDCHPEGAPQGATEGSLANARTVLKPVERFFIPNGTQNDTFCTLPLEKSNPLPIRNSEVPEININAKAAIVLDAASGKILYEKNINEILPIASLTKLMTALIVLDETNLDDIVTISKEAVETEGEKVNLIPKEKITAENLLYALLISSSNDAAVALAEYVSNNSGINGRWLHSDFSPVESIAQEGIRTSTPQPFGTMEPTVKTESIFRFIKLMNQKAQLLNLKNTHFSNPSGLDPVRNTPRNLPQSNYNIDNSYNESLYSEQISNGVDKEENYSTAYDLAHLTKHLLEKSLIWKILRIQETDIGSFDGKIIHHLENTNKLLGKLKNIVGGKTGYTDEAGECLILVAGDPTDNHQIISVVLNADDRFTETEKLVRWIFKAYSWQ